MTVRVRLYGDYLDLADELRDELVEPAKAVVSEARDVVLAEVKRLLQLQRGRPSPAGAPPAYETGDLLRSFRKLRTSVSGGTVSAGFSSSDPGVNRQEFGGRDSRGIVVPARPFVRPAFERMRGEVQRILETL